jgi:hypothetical protein
MAAIPARTELLVVAGGAHALAATPGARAALAARVAARWRQWRAGVAS